MSNEDPEVVRNRAENAARLAAEALPPEIEFKRKKFLYWNGDPPAPQITHWTKRGVFTIRANTPRLTSLVLFGDVSLGVADSDPRSVARILFNGSFDRDLGFAASEWLPSTLAGWNDQGG
jgi:hypothetical protein